LSESSIRFVESLDDDRKKNSKSIQSLAHK
jgi:hypothetical protein